VATQAALSLAKPLRAKPNGNRERIRAAFENSPWFERIAVAAPGFVNATFTREALRRLLADPIEQGAEFGRTASGRASRFYLNFDSAFRPAPMHVGHARHAAVGDSLARLFSAAAGRSTA
jgi:arginyl-tRNA synthetase